MPTLSRRWGLLQQVIGFTIECDIIKTHKLKLYTCIYMWNWKRIHKADRWNVYIFSSFANTPFTHELWQILISGPCKQLMRSRIRKVTHTKKYRNNLLWHNIPLLYVFACSTQSSSNQLKPAQTQQCLRFKNDYLFWELSRVTLCKMSGKINNAHLPSIDEYRTYLRVMIDVEDPLS